MDLLKTNYHTHTSRCGHACGTDRQYVECAVRAGLRVLGFSDHSPMIFHSEHYSGFRMPLDQTAGYFESLLRLREEFKNELTLYIGVEVEYYPDSFADYLAYMSAFPLDYKILGQHFLWKEEEGVTAFAPTEDPERLRSYYENVLAAAAPGEFLYIAHPDVLNYRGPEEAYMDLTRDFLARIKPLGVPLEINRLGLADGRHYPRRAFWELAGQAGVPAVIGLDAHDPAVFADKASVNACFALAKSYGVTLLSSLEIGC